MVIIFHDYFAIKGGGERTVLSLGNSLKRCLLIGGYYTNETYDTCAFPRNFVSLQIPSILRQFGLHLPVLICAFSKKRKFASNFSTRIYSGIVAHFAAPKKNVDGLDLLYCHTPPRFLFDQRQHFLSQQHGPTRLLKVSAMACFEWGYRRAISRMDVIVANSENTRTRIKRYLDRDSMVIYPPVEIDKFNWKGQGDYYLSTARLTSLKRVGKIVDAFVRMPDQKLIITSSGEELPEVQIRAQAAKNIEFRGWLDDRELAELIGNAIATIYVPVDEDFGISPVESMAAGKPVIGVAEGGLLETVVDGETGMLLQANFDVADLMEAVRQMSPRLALSMRDACEARATLFSTERFVSRMGEIIKSFRTPKADDLGS